MSFSLTMDFHPPRKVGNRTIWLSACGRFKITKFEARYYATEHNKNVGMVALAGPFGDFKEAERRIMEGIR